MFISIKKIALIAMCCTVSMITAQNNRGKDTLDTQVVNVVKPYAPKISDAFKVKEIPTIDDAQTATKKEVKYNIFSIPVASTFTPAKARAATVEKAKKEILHDNFLSFGGGSYTSLLGELYLNHAINRTENVGGYVSHHSSQGGIEGVPLDDDFSDSRITINYSKSLSDYAWNVDAGYQHRAFNWYGIPDIYTPEEQDMISPKHRFHMFNFGGEIEFDNSTINNGDVRFRRFADGMESGENRFIFNTNFDVPLTTGSINTSLKFDYLKGEFDRRYLVPININYGNYQIGVAPSYQIIQDDLTLNLGVSVYYLNDTELNDSKFYIYPKVTASYRVATDVLIAYGGIEGDLIQNSYYGFANENPYVSPTLMIMPTDQQYDAYIGLKGKLSNSMSYNIRGKYQAANDQALFLSNPALTDTANNEDYQYGNSFGIVYDDVDTFSIFGELNLDLNRNFTFGIQAEYFSYSSENEEEAWNLPDFEASLFMDYQISDKWFAGASLFYIGERFDQMSVDPLLAVPPTTMVLDSYFDANAHVGYRINDRWSVYLKGNNLANQAYDRWLNYRVQSLQILGGATYKFDF